MGTESRNKKIGTLKGRSMFLGGELSRRKGASERENACVGLPL